MKSPQPGEPVGHRADSTVLYRTIGLLRFSQTRSDKYILSFHISYNYLKLTPHLLKCEMNMILLSVQMSWQIFFYKNHVKQCFLVDIELVYVTAPTEQLHTEFL